ncbi:MAG: ABC transporter substrate-binding protein [Geminicoccaceae bacterium]|nr:ABC transporter substrate-binding protein [Geminicoccaceae bacterium]
MHIFVTCLGLLLLLPGVASGQDAVRTALLRVQHETPLPLSRLDLPPEDLGLAGARLAVADNNTTGRFMGQEFTLEEVDVAPEEAVAALQGALDQGARFVVTMADADTTLALADAAGERALVLNAMAPDDRLRGADCRANLLHLSPSRSMLTDALAQFLMVKRWDSWLLIEGSHPSDTLLADAYRKSAAKFGATIVEERLFEDTGAARRTDAGPIQVQKQMPVFTQRAAEHDIVLAADESEVFSGHLPYHTWEPRPVAGSAGLVPASWHPAHEAWGATQLQRRFEREAGRPMRPEDYDAWLALRVLGEAATRTESTDPDVLRDYILTPEFELAGFKGQALTFRDWDGQLRQPILLGTGRMVVSVSPQDEFIHRVSPLDTLGTDRPESACRRN